MLNEFRRVRDEIKEKLVKTIEEVKNAQRIF